MGMDTLEVPIFYGDDPKEVEPWVAWINDFAYDQGFSDFETRQFAYGFIDGEAHDWYCEELSRSVFRSWADLKLRIFQRFGKSREDPMTIELSFQDRMKELRNFIDQWIEEDEAKKQQQEKNDLWTQRIEIPLFASKTTVEVVGCEKVAEEEDPLVAIEDLVQGEQRRYETVCQLYDEMTVRGKENSKKKKKRWKTSLDCQEEWFGFDGTEREGTYHYGRKLTISKRDRYAQQVFDRMHLRGNKVKKKYARKCLRHDREGYQRTYGKLSWKYRSDKQLLVRWKGFRFKLKHDKPKENITHRLLGSHNTCIWYSGLEHERFRKNLSGWYKCGNERVHLRCVNLLQLRCLVVLNGKLLTTKMNMGAHSKYKHLNYGNLLSLVTTVGTNVLMEWKTQKDRYKYKNKHKVISANGDMDCALSLISITHDDYEAAGREGMYKDGELIVSDPDFQSMCCLVTGEYGWTADVEKAQGLRDDRMDNYMSSKEINSENIMDEVRERAEAYKSDKSVKDHILHLVEIVLLNSGFSPDEPNTFNTFVFGDVNKPLESVDSEGKNGCVAERANQVWEPGGPLSPKSQLSWLEKRGGVQILEQSDPQIEDKVGVELLNETQRRAMKPDLRLYGTVMWGLCGVRKIEADKLVMNDMQESEIKVHVLVYATLMDVHFKSGNSTEWLHLLEDMLQLVIEVTIATFFPEDSKSQLRSSSTNIGRRVVAYVTFIGEHSENHFSSFFINGMFGSPRPPERFFLYERFDKANTFRSRIHRMLEPSLRSHDEQVENITIQMLLLVKWLSELCVPTALAAAHVQMTCTEVEMDQGQGVIIVLRNGGHSNALKTQEGVGKLLYWEEMVIAGLLKLLPNPTEVEDNVLMGSTESWSSVEEYIAIMVRFFSMTLGTRSVLKGGVLIREAITG